MDIKKDRTDLFFLVKIRDKICENRSGYPKINIYEMNNAFINQCIFQFAQMRMPEGLTELMKCVCGTDDALIPFVHVPHGVKFVRSDEEREMIRQVGKYPQVTNWNVKMEEP